MPHPAFDGQTPDEMFSRTGDEVATELADERKAAQEKRLKENRSARCDVCNGETESTALLLKRARSRI